MTPQIREIINPLNYSIKNPVEHSGVIRAVINTELNSQDEIYIRRALVFYPEIRVIDTRPLEPKYFN